jgi:hypothetical protein
MGKLLLVFFVLFLGFFFGIPFYQNLTGKAKMVIYSIICLLLALIVMAPIVITF